MAEPRDLRCLAFYLPQFHPVPENHRWWGPGFTDWVNVARATARFRGHEQPHVPADLGFYDLRVPEVRAAQAELALRHAIDGFCYYHYWFEGRRILERPFDEVLRTGKPDAAFCLCWANENWTRTWDGKHTDVLLEQTYSERDDVDHVRWLCEAFADQRYVRVDGKPVFLVYRASQLPDAQRTTDTWRREAARLGIGDLYLCAVQAGAQSRVDPATLGFDAAVQFAPFFGLGRRKGRSLHNRGARRALGIEARGVRDSIYTYSDVVDTHIHTRRPAYKRYPCVSPGFDNSPRRPEGGATIITGSTPAGYERWLRATVERFEPFSTDENLVFVNAWNEWAEGNHLEPCHRWGRGYLEAHTRVFAPAPNKVER